MTYSAERQAIEARFASQWGTTTPIAWQNVAATPPSSAPWVRLSVLPGPVNRINVGTPPLHRHTGQIVMQIFTPLNEGRARAMTLADQAAAIFREAAFSDIDCMEATMTDVGPGGDAYQVNVAVGFQRDETF